MSSHSDGNGTRAGRASREKKVQNPVPLGINYLLVIGIDQYQHCPKLYNAVKDATDVTGVLTEKYQFSKQLTFSLFDKAATQDNIIAALKDLAKKVTPKDTVLIYFSGHGEYDEVLDVGYWIPVDGRLGKIGSFISFDLVMKVLKAVKSHHTFIIADSCYSGTLFTEKSLNKVLNRLEQKPSRWLITAGRNELVLDGKPGDNSPFADSVLWHLRNNHQPRLRVSQFCNDIIEDVGKNYDQVPRGASLKGVGDRGGEFMFRLKEYTLAVFDEEVAAAEEENRKRNLEEEKEATEALAETRTTIEPAPKKEETPIQSMDDLRKGRKKGER